jgi:hypothetical protein
MNVQFEIPEEDIEGNAYMAILNVFTCYYRHLFGEDTKTNMFTGADISKKDSTSRCMELFAEHQALYEEAEDYVFDNPSNIDIDEYSSMYVLIIDTIQYKSCNLLLPLIEYVAKLDNWPHLDWCIDTIKKEY